MALSLIAKKLSKQPIGTQVKVTYMGEDQQYRELSGTITDSDFSTGVEITGTTGEPVALDFDLVKGLTVTKPLTEVLRELAPGAQVRFGRRTDREPQPTLQAAVLDNDGEGSLELRLRAGEEELLSYEMIAALLVEEGGEERPEQDRPRSAPAGKGRLYERQPEHLLNASDNELKALFDALSREERKRFNAPFDSFRYGVRISDRDKMSSAANQARALALREAEKGEGLSPDGARFCGLLLRRAGVYDSEIFLTGGCYWEAALAAYREQNYIACGACALLALLEEDVEERREDLLILASVGLTGADDVSGLRFLHHRLPRRLEPALRALAADAFAYKGVSMEEGQSLEEALRVLETLYPRTAIAEEMAYWRPQGEEAEPEPEPAPQPEKDGEEPAPEERGLRMDRWRPGQITRLEWSEGRGKVALWTGEEFPFRYEDISDKNTLEEVRRLTNVSLRERTYFLKLYGEGDQVKRLERLTLVEAARAIRADSSRGQAERCGKAFDLCREALGGEDTRRAIGALVDNAITLYKADSSQIGRVQEAISLYETYRVHYPSGNPSMLMNVAQCYSYLKQYGTMLELGRRALALEGQNARQRLALLQNYIPMAWKYYEASHEKSIPEEILALIQSFLKKYKGALEEDQTARSIYQLGMLHHKITAQCQLGMLEEAERDFQDIALTNLYRNGLEELLRETRERLHTGEKEEEAPPAPAPQEEPPRPAPPQEEPLPEEEEETGEEETGGEAGEEELPPPPYEDREGWEALHLTKGEVAEEAFSMAGDLPALLTYLRAGAALTAELRPLYRAAALAADDPAEAPVYSITALSDAMAHGDADYPAFNDLCMGAAFLRTSFISGRNYDYTARDLRNSIGAVRRLPALGAVYDALEEFRAETGRAVDIYADYRSKNAQKLAQELEGAVRHAGELYTKFVLTPPREGAKLERLVRTKQIVFDREGPLAQLLHCIMERDAAGLEARKEDFAVRYLNGSGEAPFNHRNISEAAIDNLVAESWKQAGEKMNIRRSSSSLQGDRRNNLRSNISAVLKAVCTWYGLAEQSAGFTWRTPAGEESYRRLRPRLLEGLAELEGQCRAALGEETPPEERAGLCLLAEAAREMTARLDGSWSAGERKYWFAGFLQGDQILLQEDFLPDLSSTFCVLPGFNILARIRAHVRGPKLSPQEHIDRIYGRDQTCKNYGTAEKIAACLQAAGEEPPALPQDPGQFHAQSRRQAEMRLRSFRERYALAMNRGQIMASDHFCYTLEDTVQSWYARCAASQDYGFFIRLLEEAEKQIHASAQQYEEQLEQELEALAAADPRPFEEHPGCAESIRDLIAQQNFIVAEDWMQRLRKGDFSMEVQQPEALTYLEHFWSSYAVNYDRVADGSRPLSALLGRRSGRDGDTERAQRLIDCWIAGGSRAEAAQIGELLALLGWRGLQVEAVQFREGSQAELFAAWRERDLTGVTAPLHPIAPFGSELEKRRMHVACLHGAYDCDRLYEKMRALDSLNGSKVFLVDCALGSTDRRALARKLKKKETSLRNVCLVIDRVLLCHLANVYNENLVNRILMAAAMPFTYCQPYVAESSQTMPPEIFIGRKDELEKIERPDGVNLIYGGRQLGKSALFKKALSDLDGKQGQRAILIDCNKMDCAAAARRLSAELAYQGLLPAGEETEDWDRLCFSLRHSLLEREEIAYFLLMLDEADQFIRDCAGYGYRPLVALKEVQQALPGRFKYVLAGLHDVARFNRQVALGNNSVITHMSSLKINPFQSPEGEELLTVPLSYLGFSLPSKVTMSQILATVNYFPGLIQLYCQKLIESMRAGDYAGYDVKKTPPYVVSDDHLRRIISDKGFMGEIWKKLEITLTLDQDQGSYYYPIALIIGILQSEGQERRGCAARDVLRFARDLGVSPLDELDEEKTEVLLQELQDLNILRSVSEGSYVLASKNFKDLLGSNQAIWRKLGEVTGGSQ